MAAIAKLLLVTAAIIFSFTSRTFAADPDMLQDVCVADLKSDVNVNGFACKSNFTAADFFSDILAKPGVINNSMGSQATTAFVDTVPGLNTLGISLVRGDVAPNGLIAPHTHPRATEMVYVLYGELYVGFITTANVFVSKTIKTGDVFVFPKGLLHFLKNNGKVPAAVIAAFNSQLPGVQFPADSLFGASPPVPTNVLAQAFQIGSDEAEKIKAKF